MLYNKFLNLTGILYSLLKDALKQFLQKLYVAKAIEDTVNKKQLLIVFLFLSSQSFYLGNEYKVL